MKARWLPGSDDLRRLVKLRTMGMSLQNCARIFNVSKPRIVQVMAKHRSAA